mgnify:FL=1
MPLLEEGSLLSFADTPRQPTASSEGHAEELRSERELEREQQSYSPPDAVAPTSSSLPPTPRVSLAKMDLTVDSEDDDGPTNILDDTSPVRSSSQSSSLSSSSSSSDDEDAVEADTAAVPQHELPTQEKEAAHESTAADPLSPSLAISPSSTNSASDSLTTYLSAVSQRRALFLPPSSPPTPISYSMEAISTIAQGTHVHAFAVPPCSSHIYSGGQDGFIRRYALHAMLNGTGVDNPAFTNLTMKPGGSGSAVESRLPVLVNYWENEEPGPWVDDLLKAGDGEAAGPEAESRREKLKWGPKQAALGGQSPVYSIAVQREELWGLSGTAVSGLALLC